MIQKIALFGTSADPPTVAHRSILIHLTENYDQVGVWASDNPFKKHSSSLEHRLAMLKLLIDDINHPHLHFDEKLSDRRSLITLKKAQSQWGVNADYTLVIGSDLIPQIHKWYHIRELLSQTKLYIFPRPHYPLKPSHLQELDSLGGDYIISNIQPPAVSSTEYRQGKKDTIIPAIQNYIQTHHLYHVCNNQSMSDVV